MNRRTDEPFYLTADEVAAALRVSRNVVYRLVERGEITAMRIGKGPKATIRIPRTELDRYTAATVDLEKTIGVAVDQRANQILAQRGIDPTKATPDEYADAVREAGYAAAIYAERVGRQVVGDMRAHAAGLRVAGADLTEEDVDTKEAHR